MKIKRSVLERIVKEELALHIREMSEGPKEDDKGPNVVDAEAETKGKEKKDPAKTKDSDQNKAAKANDKSKPKELPVDDEPEADPELEKDVAGEDDEEDADEITGGKIADEVTGKTIQSITMEPKSKVLPGAQELTITFKEIPDPLKILITKTGQTKFVFRGLHNTL